MARLVLLHGTRFDSRQWRRYPDLLPSHDLVPLDLPGHGTRAGQSFTLEEALTLIDEAVGQRPSILVGHSLGGYLAATYAERYPERLTGLGLIGASADPRRHRLLSGLYRGFASLVDLVGPQRLAAASNVALRALGSAEEDLPDSDGYMVLRDAWSTVLRTAHRGQLRGVQCPVLVMNGQYDQMRIDASAYASMARYSRLVTVPGATHLLPTTHPQAVAGGLEDLAEKSLDRSRGMLRA